VKDRVLSTILILFGMWVAMTAACTPAHAEDAPILSMRRVSFATGVDTRWLDSNVAPSWQVGVFGAYNIIPHASLVGSTVYDFKGLGLEYRVGIRIRIFQGRQ
jgi:hypothetical protein